MLLLYFTRLAPAYPGLLLSPDSSTRCGRIAMMAESKKSTYSQSHRNASCPISYANTSAGPSGTNARSALFQPTLHGPQASPAQRAEAPRYYSGCGAPCAVVLIALNNSLRKMTGARRISRNVVLGGHG